MYANIILSQELTSKAHQSLQEIALEAGNSGDNLQDDYEYFNHGIVKDDVGNEY